jgi:hypothetical protein
MLVISLIAALIAVAAAVVSVIVVLKPGGKDPGEEIPPGAAGAAQNLDLVDGGDRITLTWTDPSNGTALPIVVGNRENEATRRMSVPAKGATETTLLSLNRNDEYCFSILLAYSIDDVRQSEQVCTNRKNSSPSPSK